MYQRTLRSYERWTTDQHDTDSLTTTELTPGTLVIWGKEPFRVLTVGDLNRGNWPDDWETLWEEAGHPDITTWPARPFWITVQNDRKTGDPERGKIVPADGKWVTLPEHYSVCQRCGELPPCKETFTDRVLEVEGRRIEFEMRLVHGMCHACGRPVTGREHSTLFPGDNLVRPDLGTNTAVFHTRRSCLPVALAYQDRWMDAEEGRAARLQTDGRACWSPGHVT